jgi:protein involved in polysaccharide export with SLBB domain
MTCQRPGFPTFKYEEHNSMLPHTIYSGVTNPPRYRRSYGIGYRMLSLRLMVAAPILAVFIACGNPLRAQATDVTPTQNAGQAAAGGSDATSSVESSGQSDDQIGSAGAGNLMPNSVLSADRIIELLQQDPDLVVELKSLMADRMQGQGVQITANDISDETLYDQIAANSSLRSGITVFLRARGYISPDDLQGAEVSPLDENANGGLAAQRSVMLPNPTGGTASMTEGSLGLGQFGIGASGVSAPATQSANNTATRQLQQPMRQRHEESHSATDAPKVLRRPAPYNLQSMRDLYTQIPEPAEHLKRFGSEMFVGGGAAVMRGIGSRDTPLDVPLGPDYVLGPGDSLTIDLWGGVTQSITRTVDRDGRLLLPEAAPIEVAGLTLERAQGLIAAALKQQYRNAQAVVTVSRPRSVRLYVVGDVQRPGGYDVSSLATPLSAFYAAGGPTAAGSLRALLHYRGKQLVEQVDLYDFLLHGIRSKSAPFESGDTLLVPPAGAQVAISGAVKRPAIYELASGPSMLAAIIDYAGGLTAAASLDHIRIERINPNQQRETVTVNLKGNGAPDADREALNTFSVKDGDRIYVEPIFPYSKRVVYLEGHVVRPGRLPYTDGMRLSDALESYRDLLPEPAAHGELVRLVAPDLHAETIDFDVPDVLIGNANIELKPFDTIRVFGRYEADAPKVTVLGEVLRPGEYPMSTGMTAAQLVRMAGGFKRDALLDSADLTSYEIVNGTEVAGNLTTVPIGAAVTKSDPHADVLLKPGDILMVHQMTGWNEIGQSVSIEGQVKFPGRYGFREGERLSWVLRRAGGFLPTAYPMGAVLVREQVRDLEEKSRDELIRQIETNSAAARLSPSLAGANAGNMLQMIKVQQDEVISELRSHPPAGRMVVQITADIDRWAGTPADIELRQGDVVTIPKRPGFVLVTGQVYNATALAYAPDKTAGWYLSHAGGANSTADRKEIFIIRANGSVIGRRSGGWFEGDVLSTRLNPGDVVVVPQKVIGSSVFWRNLLTAGQIAASAALTAGVAAAAL